MEEDLEKIQQVIDSGKISPKKKDEWLAIGITVCAILTNEVEGMEWKTLIDGNRESPYRIPRPDHRPDENRMEQS